MANLSYNTLLKRYKELKERKDNTDNDYYYYANKNQIEKNDKLRKENNQLKKKNIELSCLVTELMKEHKQNIELSCLINEITRGNK